MRNHVFLAFPKHNIAYARIAEPAFQLLRPVLHRLAGIDRQTSKSVQNQQSDEAERLLFHGDVELLTARELKRRHPDMKIAAWVQDPSHRLAYCYEKIILKDTPLPAYYEERHFSKAMSPQEFVAHVSHISDLEADNLFRGQAAALTYKGILAANLILPLEDFDRSMATFLSESALRFRMPASANYDVSQFVTGKTLLAFAQDGVVQKLRRRYRADYQLFYAPEVLSA
ncbi:sulfotransferase family 2 domain-containing protein [Roseibium sp. M-1]